MIYSTSLFNILQLLLYWEYYVKNVYCVKYFPYIYNSGTATTAAATTTTNTGTATTICSKRTYFF